MPLLSFQRAPLAAAVSLMLAAPAGAATGDTLTLRALSGGSAFTGFDLAATPNGFVAVWAERDGSAQHRLLAQRYNDQGEPLDDAFLVHAQDGSGSLGRPSVAADQNGNLVVGWESDGSSQFPEDCGDGLHFTRVSANDTVAEPAVPYQNYVVGACGLDVAMDDDGDFLVTWTSALAGQGMEQLGLRSYLANGTPIVDQAYRHAATKEVRLGHASLQGNGAMAIAFRSGDRVRLLSNPSINLNSDQYNFDDLDNDDADFGDGVTQDGAIVAPDQEGGFVGVWRQHAPDAEAGETYSLRAQRWRADGTAGDALLLATAAEGFSAPSLATNDAGQMVAVWSFQTAGEAPEAGAVAFDANGQRLGKFDWAFSDLNALGADGAPRVALHDDAVLVAWYGDDERTLQARSLNMSDAQTGNGGNGGGSGGGGGGGTTGLLALFGLGLLALRRRVRR